MGTRLISRGFVHFFRPLLCDTPALIFWGRLFVNRSKRRQPIITTNEVVVPWRLLFLLDRRLRRRQRRWLRVMACR